MAEAIPGAQVPPEAPLTGDPAPAIPAAPVAAVPPAPAAPVVAAPVPPADPPAVPAAPVVPETYALTLPTGSEEWLDDADLANITTIAKANKWTNDQAQQKVNEHVGFLTAQSTAFRAATEGDPIYGGDHLVETQKNARLALERVRPAGTPHGDALRTLLAKSGYGNHLEVVSFLADLGKLMAEDSPALSRSGDGARRDPAAVLYDAKPPA